MFVSFGLQQVDASIAFGLVFKIEAIVEDGSTIWKGPWYENLAVAIETLNQQPWQGRIVAFLDERSATPPHFKKEPWCTAGVVYRKTSGEYCTDYGLTFHSDAGKYVPELEVTVMFRISAVQYGDLYQRWVCGHDGVSLLISKTKFFAALEDGRFPEWGKALVEHLQQYKRVDMIRFEVKA